MTNADIVREAVEALNDGDFDAYRSIFTDDCVRWTAGIGEGSAQDSIELIRQLHASFTGLRLDAELLLESGSHVVARWLTTGEHTAEFAGIPATGRRVSIPVCEVYEFNGDRVSRTWAYGDPLDLPRQLGVLPVADGG